MREPAQNEIASSSRATINASRLPKPEPSATEN
jgi:hypothetical protein